LLCLDAAEVVGEDGEGPCVADGVAGEDCGDDHRPAPDKDDGKEGADDAVEALARGGDVVVEEQDGGFDQAEVEDEVDAIDPDCE
jgi:hypothetical protein